MKKRILLVALAVLFALPAFNTVSRAATGVSFETGAILPDDGSKLRILTLDITFDMAAGEAVVETAVKNGGGKFEGYFSVKAEDEIVGQKLASYEIRHNGVKLESKLEDGRVRFKAMIPAGETAVFKAVLRPEGGFDAASLIRADVDGVDFGGSVARVRFFVNLREEDIALTRSVFPGHWTLDGNLLSMDYYDMTVNSINRYFVLEKATWQQMWMEAEDRDAMCWFIENARKWIKDTPELEYDKDWPYFGEIRYHLLETYAKAHPEVCEDEDYYPDADVYGRQVEYALNYVVLKFMVNQGIFTYLSSNDVYWWNLSPLAREWFFSRAQEYPAYFKQEFPLYGKLIGVEYAKNSALDGVELWVNVFDHIDWDENEGETYFDHYENVPQERILPLASSSREVSEVGARIVEFACGKYPREDVAEYLASVGADLLIVQKIFDDTDGRFAVVQENWGAYMDNDGIVGYRADADYEMARIFYDQDEWFSDDPDWEYDPSEWIIKDHDDGLAYSKIPAVVSYIASAVNVRVPGMQEGTRSAYVLVQSQGFYRQYKRGLRTAEATLATDRARELLRANDSALEIARTRAEQTASSIPVYPDVIEQTPAPEPEAKDRTPYILLGSLALAALAIVLIIIYIVKEKRKDEE